MSWWWKRRGKLEDIRVTKAAQYPHPGDWHDGYNKGWQDHALAMFPPKKKASWNVTPEQLAHAQKCLNDNLGRHDWWDMPVPIATLTLPSLFTGEAALATLKIFEGKARAYAKVGAPPPPGQWETITTWESVFPPPPAPYTTVHVDCPCRSCEFKRKQAAWLKDTTDVIDEMRGGRIGSSPLEGPVLPPARSEHSRRLEGEVREWGRYQG